MPAAEQGEGCGHESHARGQAYRDGAGGCCNGALPHPGGARRRGCLACHIPDAVLKERGAPGQLLDCGGCSARRCAAALPVMPSAVLEALGGDAGSARTASSALHLPPTRLPACLPIHLPARCRGMPLPPCCPFSCGARRAAPTATLTGCPSPAPLGVAWWTLTQLSLTASSPVPFRLARTCELSTCPLPRFALRSAAQHLAVRPCWVGISKFGSFHPHTPWSDELQSLRRAFQKPKRHLRSSCHVQALPQQCGFPAVIDTRPAPGS